MARKHSVLACDNRSTCCGPFFRLGARSIQPGSLAPAFELLWIFTSVTVTNTWLYGPLGAEQVGGSLTEVFTNPVGELLPPPLQPTSTRTTATTVAPSVTMIERDIRYPLETWRMIEVTKQWHLPNDESISGQRAARKVT